MSVGPAFRLPSTFRDPDYAAEFVRLNEPAARKEEADGGRRGGA